MSLIGPEEAALVENIRLRDEERRLRDDVAFKVLMLLIEKSAHDSVLFRDIVAARSLVTKDCYLIADEFVSARKS